MSCWRRGEVDSVQIQSLCGEISSGGGTWWGARVRCSTELRTFRILTSCDFPLFMALLSLFPSRSASMAHSRSVFCSAIASSRTRPLRKATTPTSSSIEAQRPLVYRELAARGFAGSLRWKVQGARESLLDGAGGCAPVALDLAEAICLCFCCLNFCCSAAADWLLTREFPSDVKGNSEGRYNT